MSPRRRRSMLEPKQECGVQPRLRHGWHVAVDERFRSRRPLRPSRLQIPAGRPDRVDNCVAGQVFDVSNRMRPPPPPPPAAVVPFPPEPPVVRIAVEVTLASGVARKIHRRCPRQRRRRRWSSRPRRRCRRCLSWWTHRPIYRRGRRFRAPPPAPPVATPPDPPLLPPKNACVGSP